MKTHFSTFIISLVTAAQLAAQPIISDTDMAFKTGEYYKAYANTPSILVDVSSVIGKKGGPQFWDFSTGPTNDVFLYEYIDPRGTAVGTSFPRATVAERKTTLSTGDQEWLFYTQVPNVGRTVYGAYSNDGLFADAAQVFGAPVVDFPVSIKLGDTWSNVITWTNNLGLLGDDFPVRIIITSSFSADAYGVADLPNLGFGDVLRVNQLDEIQLQLFSEDDEGQGSFNSLGAPVFSRFFYWLMQGRGIVATISSETTGNLEGNATPPPDNFARAGYLVRMFETNKKLAQGCDRPSPVTDLKITVDSKGRALLKWTVTECTVSYRVEYTENLGAGVLWTSVGSTPSNFLIDPGNTGTKARYYRVVSIK